MQQNDLPYRLDKGSTLAERTVKQGEGGCEELVVLVHEAVKQHRVYVPSREFAKVQREAVTLDKEAFEVLQ